VSLSFLGRRLGAALATLIFVIAFNFVLFRIIPADPVAAMLRGRNVSPEAIEKIKRDFALDKPLPQQFVRYVSELAHGNLGVSLTTRRPVTQRIGERIWPTIVLVGLSTLLSSLIGVFLGIHAAWRRGTAFDLGTTSFTMLTYAMPDFYLGILLFAAFAGGLGWLPTGGLIDPSSGATGIGRLLEEGRHLILPCLTLTLAYLGEYAIIMRSSLIEVMGEDYLVTARAKGLRDSLVRRRHAVPNALLPTVTLIALNFGYVLSGAIAVETVFSWPGLGQLTSQAVGDFDYPLLQGLFLVFSASVIVANLIADVLYGVLDPRVRVAT